MNMSNAVVRTIDLKELYQADLDKQVAEKNMRLEQELILQRREEQDLAMANDICLKESKMREQIDKKKRKSDAQQDIKVLKRRREQAKRTLAAEKAYEREEI